MSTAIRLVSQNSQKNFPRDPTKTLAALMSLRFAMNYDSDADYQEDIKTADSNWLCVVGDFINWPTDILQDFESASNEELSIEEMSLKPRSRLRSIKLVPTYWDNVFNHFCDTYSKQKNRLDHLFFESIIHLEKHWANVCANDTASQNIRLLSDMLTLNDAERALLCYLAHRQSKNFKAFKTIEFISYPVATKVLACMLNIKFSDITTALHPKSILVKNNIINKEYVYAEWHDFISLWDHFRNIINIPNNSLEELMGHFVAQTTSGHLTISDMPHLEDTIKILIPTLENALKAKATGVNILLYGPPGTGKTQLAKLLAQSVNANLYEVSSSDESGTPINDRERFIAHNMAQSFLASRENTLILFDEVEDVLSLHDDHSSLSAFNNRNSKGCFNKAWINEQLESNVIPTIWICNNHDDINNAFLRRFIYTLEITTPPRTIRENIARNYLNEFNLGDSVLKKISQHEHLSPAQLETAARLVKLNGSTNRAEIENILDKSLFNSMKIMGQKHHPVMQSSITPYSLDYLNVDTSVPLERLVIALKKTTKVNLCFYGHPGTGKTQLAEYLSEALDKPILIKRASDLLDAYIGENEKNIAAIFAEATKENAILFLDEADSFLRKRENMTKNWEVSQVNELLQQMERFNGIFICATNLFNHLDQAALRRFVFKIRFDYLTLTQRQSLFAKSLSISEKEIPSEDLKRLTMLTTLAPGDFATVLKQATLLDEAITSEELVSQLEKECNIKQGNKIQQRIGFI